MSDNPRILIVGAGPTGLTAALELYRHGYTPRVIDRKEGPSPLSRAVGIAAHSLELLEESGATDALLATGQKIRELYLHDYKRRLCTLQFHRLSHRYNFLLALPQNETERIMSDQLERLGGCVEYHTELQDLRIEREQAIVCINDTAEESYDLLIGADGIHSKTRNCLGIEFNGYDYPDRWSITDFESYDWPGKSADLLMLPDGHMRFIIRIGKHRYRAVADQLDTLSNIPFSFTVDTIHHQDSFVISVRQAAQYQQHPVYLAGDAAHVHSPAGARGMNLGIEDAHELATRIHAKSLSGYHDCRHPIGARWIKVSERMVAGATVEHLPGRLLRRLVLGSVSMVPILQGPLLKRVSGLIE